MGRPVTRKFHETNYQHHEKEEPRHKHHIPQLKISDALFIHHHHKKANAIFLSALNASQCETCIGKPALGLGLGFRVLGFREAPHCETCVRNGYVVVVVFVAVRQQATTTHRPLLRCLLHPSRLHHCLRRRAGSLPFSSTLISFASPQPPPLLRSILRRSPRQRSSTFLRWSCLRRGLLPAPPLRSQRHRLSLR